LILAQEKKRTAVGCGTKRLPKMKSATNWGKGTCTNRRRRKGAVVYILEERREGREKICLASKERGTKFDKSVKREGAPHLAKEENNNRRTIAIVRANPFGKRKKGGLMKKKKRMRFFLNGGGRDAAAA